MQVLACEVMNQMTIAVAELQAMVSLSCKPLCWHVRPSHKVMPGYSMPTKLQASAVHKGLLKTACMHLECDLQPSPEAAMKLSCAWGSLPSKHRQAAFACGGAVVDSVHAGMRVA